MEEVQRASGRGDGECGCGRKDGDSRSWGWWAGGDRRLGLTIRWQCGHVGVRGLWWRSLSTVGNNFLEPEHTSANVGQVPAGVGQVPERDSLFFVVSS